METMQMTAILSHRVAIPTAVISLAVAAYLYYLSVRRLRQKKRQFGSITLGVAILLTVLGVLLPVLSFDLVSKLKFRTSTMAKNGVAPPAVIFA